MSKLLLNIVTPEKPLLSNKEVTSIVIPAWGGEMGILADHAPFVVQIKEGILKYEDDSGPGVFAVAGGFAEINKNVVSVFAEAAELSDEIDAERAKQALQKARDSLAAQGRDMDIDVAQAALRRAVVRLKAAGVRKVHRMRRD